MGCYSVDLDDTTGVHHVTLFPPRTDLPINKLSDVNFSGHVVQFSNGEMTAVPRLRRATTSLKRKARKTVPSYVRDQATNNQSRLPDCSVSTYKITVSNETLSAPAQSDSSIVGLGRVGDRQAARDQSNLSHFRKSTKYILPQNTAASASIKVECSDAVAEAQEAVVNSVDKQTSDSSSSFRQSSAGSLCNDTSKSTVPTSPASSLLSSLSFRHSALADLPKVPVAPGKPTYVIEALALEEPKRDDLGKTDYQEATLNRRLSWDLVISYRQLQHWDEIQDGKASCFGEVSVSGSGLTMTEGGQIVVAEDVSNNVQSSVTAHHLTSKPVKALSSFHSDMINSSQLLDALDIVRIELLGPKHSRLFPLDLVKEAKGKQRATGPPKSQHSTPVRDDSDVGNSTDSASGKLSPRSEVNVPLTIIQSIPAATSTPVATGSSDQTHDSISICPLYSTREQLIWTMKKSVPHLQPLLLMSLGAFLRKRSIFHCDNHFTRAIRTLCFGSFLAWAVSP